MKLEPGMQVRFIPTNEELKVTEVTPGGFVAEDPETGVDFVVPEEDYPLYEVV